MDGAVFSQVDRSATGVDDRSPHGDSLLYKYIGRLIDDGMWVRNFLALSVGGENGKIVADLLAVVAKNLPRSGEQTFCSFEIYRFEVFYPAEVTFPAHAACQDLFVLYQYFTSFQSANDFNECRIRAQGTVDDQVIILWLLAAKFVGEEGGCVVRNYLLKVSLPFFFNGENPNSDLTGRPDIGEWQ